MSTSDASTDRLTYQPALDGLRALAVAAVVIFHLDETGLSGGFLGVDTFFVLSGYLITTLLLHEWRRHERIDVLAFWGRRARRLLPALLLMVGAVAIFAAVEVPSTEYRTLRGDGIAGLFYVANWRFVVSGQSYFDLFQRSPFRHLWSLAIEEQFYLVWPLVASVAFRWDRGRVRILTLITTVGILASTILMAVLYDATDPSRAYYGTDTHAHAILVGVLLAIGLRDRRPATSPRARTGWTVAGTVALIAMLAAFAFAHDTSARLYRGGSLAFALAAAVLIAALILAPQGALARAFALRPFVALGLISYGVYLWHWPVIVYATSARTGLDDPGLLILQIGLTLGLSIASYFLVELPVRRRFTGKATAIFAPAGLAIGLAAMFFATTGATAPVEAAPLPVTSTTLGPTTPGNPVHAVLVGDSLARSLGPGLDDAMTARGVTFEAAATPGCSILRGVTVRDDGRPYPWSQDCARAIPAALRTVVSTEPKPDLVLWLASWDAVDRTIRGRRLGIEEPTDRPVLAREVQRAARLLTANGARLMILTVPDPVPGTETVLPGLDEEARVAALNRLYRRAALTADGQVRVLDLAAIVCPDGRCPREIGGVNLRPDGSHFGVEGSRWVGDQLTTAALRCWRDPDDCD